MKVYKEDNVRKLVGDVVLKVLYNRDVTFKEIQEMVDNTQSIEIPYEMLDEETLYFLCKKCGTVYSFHGNSCNKILEI